MNPSINTNELELNGFFGRARAEHMRRASLLPDGAAKNLCLKRAAECLAESEKLAAGLIGISEHHAKVNSAQ